RAPGKPVDGIVGMELQIGTLLRYQPIGIHAPAVDQFHAHAGGGGTGAARALRARRVHRHCQARHDEGRSHGDAGAKARVRAEVRAHQPLHIAHDRPDYVMIYFDRSMTSPYVSISPSPTARRRSVTESRTVANPTERSDDSAVTLYDRISVLSASLGNP